MWRVFGIMIAASLFTGCAHVEQGNAENDTTTQVGSATNATGSVLPDRGGRATGGTGRAGMTVGGTGSAPER